MYFRKDGKNPSKWDQVVKVCGPLRRGLQVPAIMARQYVSEGYLNVSVKGTVNWWRLPEKVALTVREY